MLYAILYHLHNVTNTQGGVTFSKVTGLTLNWYRWGVQISTPSFIMLKSGLTNFKNIAVIIPQGFPVSVSQQN